MIFNALTIFIFTVCKSGPHQFEGKVDQHFIAISEDDLQIDLKVNLAPGVFDRGAGVIPRKNHIQRNLHVTSHVSIANLDELNLCLFVERSALSLDLFYSEHLQVYGTNCCICQVDYYGATEVIVEKYVLGLKLALDFEDGHFSLVSFHLSTDHHEMLLLGVDKIIDGFSASFGHLNIEWYILLDLPETVDLDMSLDQIANSQIDTNVGLEIFILPRL